MKSEQRSLLAIVLSIGVLVVWYMLFSPHATHPPAGKPEAKEEATTTATAEPATTKSAAEKTAAPTSELNKGPEKTVQLSTPRFDVTFSTYGARVTSVVLKNYHATVAKDAPLVNLVSYGSDQALVLKCRHCNVNVPSDAEYALKFQDERGVRFRWDGPKISIIRSYTIDEDRYLIDQKVTVINHSDEAMDGELGLSWTSHSPPVKKSFLKRTDNGALDVVYQLGGSLKRIHREKKDHEGLGRGVVSWAGLESRYFLTALISRQLSDQEVVTYDFVGDDVGTALYYPAVSLRPGDQVELQYSAYMGPKEINELSAVGVGLDSSIDHGWFAVIATPILYSLRFFHDYLHSWGLAIILLTFIFKILLNPLTVKGLKSMKAMQKLQPQLAELREKFKDDKARLNQETMAMFRAHKVNPMGGCLPMLIQMPIYIALYRVLFSSIELRHTPFLFYKDLAAPDPYYVTPVLLGIFMVLQQRMTPTTSADPMQKKMMMFMPIMFTVFMVFLPMGLVLYILVNTVLTVVQHYMFNHDIRWRDILRGRIKLR